MVCLVASSRDARLLKAPQAETPAEETPNLGWGRLCYVHGRRASAAHIGIWETVSLTLVWKVKGRPAHWPKIWYKESR